MKYILMTFTACCLALAASAQALYVETGGLVYITDPASVDAQSGLTPSLYVDGNIQNLGTIENYGELQLTGDFNKPGFYLSLGDDVFKGTSAQSFTGNFDLAGGSNFYNLILNNAGNQLTANGAARINNALVLENGILTTNGQVIHLLNTAASALTGSNTSGAADRFVNGTLRQSVTTGQNYSFKVGDLTHGNQIANVLFTNTGGATYMDMGYSSSGSGGITPISIPTGCIGTYDKSGGTWTATADGVNGTYNYSFTAVPGGLNLSSLSGSLYDALYKDAVFASDPCAGGFGNYSASGLTSFSTFRVLGGPTSALPVTVTRFEGQQEGSLDVLRWTTQGEQNAAHFVLSHSKDGLSFSEVARVASQAPNGHSAWELTYEAQYIQPTPGHNYYRLEQVDLDGQRYLHQQLIDLKRSADGLVSLQLYPNPAKGLITASITQASQGKGLLTVTDLSGRTLKSLPVEWAPGSQQISVDLANMVPGIYLMHLRTNQAETLVSRFEVTR